jgi:hypothetical protein
VNFFAVQGVFVTVHAAERWCRQADEQHHGDVHGTSAFELLNTPECGFARHFICIRFHVNVLGAIILKSRQQDTDSDDDIAVLRS